MRRDTPRFHARTWTRTTRARWTSLFVGGATALGCGVTPGVALDRGPDAGTERVVEFQPPNLDQRALAQVFTVGGSRPLLFEGLLGSAHLAQIQRGALSQALTERWVPSATWSTASGWGLAPLHPLPTGVYSLANATFGLLEEFEVAQLPQALELVWPRPGQGLLAPDLVVCHPDAERVIALGSEPLLLHPGDIPALAASAATLLGAAASHCVHIALEQMPPGPWVILPASLFGESVVPAQIAVAQRTGIASQAPSCADGEITVASGCLGVEDERLAWRAEAQDVLWSVSGPQLQFLAAVSPGERAIQGGLEPETTYSLEVRTLDLTGQRSSLMLEITTARPRPRTVINEVLSNPLGPEPNAEWVELVNPGSVAVELGDFDLMDSLEPNALPAFSLAPGAFALVVADAYVASSADAALPPEVPLLRVARLGRSGITNTGELLQLVRRDGALFSQFPALAAPLAGVSLARATPDTPDQEASGFGLHAQQASPGAANLLRSED